MNYEFRYIRTDDPDIPTGEVGEVDQPFFAYASDTYIGTRIIFSGLNQNDTFDYTWRFRTRGAGGFLIGGVDLRLTRDNGGPVTQHRLYYDHDEQPFGNWLSEIYTGVIQWIDLGHVFSPRNEYEYLSSLDTVIVEYEFLNGSTLVVPVTEIGNGFDLRDLYIPELQLIEPKINYNDPDPAKHTMKLKGEVQALPVSTTLFPGGWQPVGDLTYIALSSNGSTIADEQLTIVPGPNGKVASFETVWNGKDVDENVLGYVKGLHIASVSTSGENPNNFPQTTFSTDSSGGADALFLAVGCPTDTTRTCHSGLVYNGNNSDQGTSSPGYGWSSEASIRIVVSGDDVFLKTSSGTSFRWVYDGTNYEPSLANTYTLLEQESTHWRVRFKDQSNWYLRISDGKLDYKTDRNSNVTSYSYDANGHLSSISDQNGNSVSYTNRSDGQPEFMNVNGTRATSYSYYPGTHPTSPNRLRSITDPEGNRTEYIYNDDGKLYSIIDPQGHSMFYEYDGYGRVVREQYGADKVVTYTYREDFESFGDGTTEVEMVESSLSEPLYRQTFISRDQLGRTLETRELVHDPQLYDPNASPFDREYRTTSYEYNNPNEPPFNNNPYLVTTTTDDNMNTTVMTYTDNGNIKTVQDKDGYVTTYEYAEEIDSPLNPKHRNLVRKVYRPSVTVDGTVVTYNPTEFQYDIDGNLEKIIDAKGQETVMVTDADGLVTSVTDRNGNTTEFIYDGLPHNGDPRTLRQIRTPKGESPSDGFRTVFLDYDDFDNVIAVRDDLGNEVETTYDDLDRPLTVTDARNYVTTYIYDKLLLDEVSAPPNNGSMGQVRKTSMSYDSSNRLTEMMREIDALGNQVTRVKYAYSGFSEILSLIRFQNGEEKSFNFVYDQAGRQISASDPLPNGTSTMAYEPFCLGSSTTSARGIRRRSSYGPRCLLNQVDVGDVDPNDPLELLNIRQTRTWNYDELGRMIGSVTSSAKYGEAQPGFDRWGSGGSRSYLYDELDRLTKMTFDDGSDMEWEYDPEGNVTKVTDPLGKISKYEYYRDYLVHKVILERNGSDVGEFVYSYDDAGRLDRILYPASTNTEALFRDEADLSATGIGTGFDANGNLRFLRYQKTDGTLIRRFEWTYDESNNRSSMLEVSPSAAIRWEYGYDWLDRLVTVKRATAADVASLPASPLGASALQREYVFDESDNRTFFDDHVNGQSYHYKYRTVDDSGTTRYTDQVEEILVSSTVGERNENNFSSLETFEYDLDGNLIKRTFVSSSEEITYEWTDFDRLKKVISNQEGRLQDARYELDGLRERKFDKNGNSSTEYGVGISTAASKAGNSNSSAPSISYISGHTILGAEVDGNFIYHLGDALGTVRDVLDSNGNVIKSFEFDEYGNPLNSSGTGTATPKTWIGGLSVNDDTADSGMFNMGHRNYAGGVLGRFISRDPIGHQGGLNLYAYPTNPVKHRDPTGLDLSYITGEDCQKDKRIKKLADSWIGQGITNPTNLDWNNKIFLDLVTSDSTGWLGELAANPNYDIKFAVFDYLYEENSNGGGAIYGMDGNQLSSHFRADGSLEPGSYIAAISRRSIEKYGTHPTAKMGHELGHCHEALSPGANKLTEQDTIREYEDPLRSDLGLKLRKMFTRLPRGEWFGW